MLLIPDLIPPVFSLSFGGFALSQFWNDCAHTFLLQIPWDRASTSTLLTTLVLNRIPSIKESKTGGLGGQQAIR